MRVLVKHGDILDEVVDVLICSANVQLNMSGGVNGAILQRGGSDVQAELRSYLAQRDKTAVVAGSVVRTGPGPLQVSHILHAVAIDAFYDSSTELVSDTIRNALAEAGELGAHSVALPALATGYGPLSVAEFGCALRQALDQGPYRPIEELRVVLAKEASLQELGL